MAEALLSLDPQPFISVSNRVMPQYREYERTSTVAANAYVGPVMAGYLRRLETALGAKEARPGRVRVMQSSGGSVSLGAVAGEPVRTVLSGPAGGVVGALAVARMAGPSQHHHVGHGRHFHRRFVMPRKTAGDGCGVPGRGAHRGADAGRAHRRGRRRVHRARRRRRGAHRGAGVGGRRPGPGVLRGRRRTYRHGRQPGPRAHASGGLSRWTDASWTAGLPDRRGAAGRGHARRRRHGGVWEWFAW